MKILVIALLKESQINYKIKPLSFSSEVEEIYLVRKRIGPKIPKVKYIVLPNICRFTFFYLSLTPLIVLYHLLHKRIDLILSYHFVPHGFFAFLTSFLTGVPFIYSQIDMDIQNYMKNSFKKYMILKILKRAKRINVPGSNSINFWLNQGIDKSKMMSIHSTIDTENEFFPEEKEKIYDLIFVGKLEKRKRIDLIIKALHEVRKQILDFKFAIVGDGEEYNFLQTLINQNKLQNNIELLGYRNNIKQLLLSSKYFILLSENEGVPCAMMEAMACEIVPVVTNVADISDVVRDQETGILLKPDPTIGEISKILFELLSNYSKTKYLSSNARKQIVKHNSYRAATQKWNNTLIELLNE